jgi:hypothetical protein
MAGVAIASTSIVALRSERLTAECTAIGRRFERRATAREELGQRAGFRQFPVGAPPREWAWAATKV